MRRLAPATALSLLPSLARAAELQDTLVPILVVGIVFGFSALVVGMVFYAVHRAQRLRHETIRLALEKGQPLPADLLDPPARRDPKLRDLRRGLLLLAFGIGVCLYLGLSPLAGVHREWPAGFVPGLMGLAYLATWAVGRSRTGQERTDGR